MTRNEALFKVFHSAQSAIARAIDEDRDYDYDKLVHAIESFDDLSNYLIRRLTD